MKAWTWHEHGMNMAWMWYRISLLLFMPHSCHIHATFMPVRKSIFYSCHNHASMKIIHAKTIKFMPIRTNACQHRIQVFIYKHENGMNVPHVDYIMPIHANIRYKLVPNYESCQFMPTQDTSFHIQAWKWHERSTRRLYHANSCQHKI